MKKPRSLFINIELREDTRVNWNEAEKQLEFLDSQGNPSKKNLLSVGQSYERTGKRPKVLRQVKSPIVGVVKLDAVTAPHDRYFAVDTSYKRFGDNYLCATAGLCIDQAIDHKIGLRKGEQITMFSMPRLIFLAKLDSKPERYGWMRAIDAIVRHKERDPNLNYGIVVDSDLGSIPKINAGEESISADYFLPEKFSLIYASADIGKDTLINKLMKATDQVANKSLKVALQQNEQFKNFSFDRPFWDINILNDLPAVVL